jgi:hypothetical protein
LLALLTGKGLFLKCNSFFRMKKLTQLIRRTPVAKLKATGLWGTLLEPNSKMEQLCDAILNGQVKTDEEAVQLLYPGEKAGTKYYNVKERLKEKLLHAVLWTDTRDSNPDDRQSAYFECNKRWSIAMTLMNRNAKSNSVEVLEDIVKHSTRFEFTELSIHVLSSLRLYYSTVLNDSVKYHHYRNMLVKYRTIWAAENEVEDQYLSLINQFVYNKPTRQSLSAAATEIYGSIEHYMHEHRSFRVQLCGRLIQLSIYTGTNDFERIIDLSRDAIEFFGTKPYNSTLALQTFYYQQMVCYIHLEDYERGKRFKEAHSDLFEANSYNWFKWQELTYLLHMHTAKFQEAHDLSKYVQQCFANSAQPVQIVEIWKLYEAYASLLIYFHETDEQKREALLNSFKVTKIINDIPSFHKDKRGMNIPIIVLQLLYNLAQKNYNSVIDRIDAIEKYCSRYLNNNETFRSNCFIRMLLSIPAVSFKKAQVQQRTAKNLEMLRSKPLNMTSQSYEVEIIPYERLWEILSTQLPENVARVKPRKRNPKAA